MNDSINGIGVVVGLLAILIYLGGIAVTLWIGYLLMRTAVKNGTIKAYEEMDRRAVEAEAAFQRRERHDARTSAERALADIRASRARTAEALSKRNSQP
ncbi:hypothetical protein [Microbacterium paludicola]|uniref:hypothetical protein n=1 Tax=Microbacterium paludicola TaxID=300019 RepID=UPI0011A79F6D|nr:hypothetical protein [Microbacterium paludicola]